MAIFESLLPILIKEKKYPQKMQTKEGNKSKGKTTEVQTH